MTHAAAHIQWGDAAEWVGSLATSGALLLTYGLLRLTREDQQVLSMEQRLGQARKVSAWCEKVTPSDGRGPDDVVVRLRNGSDEPIYGIRVAVGADWWSENTKYVEIDLGYVVSPHYNEEHAVKLRVGREPDGTVEISPPVEIIFSDASGGRFWHRDRYGGLREITEKLPPSAAEHFFKSPTNTAVQKQRGRAYIRRISGSRRRV
jgi:hypothetical protein